MVPVHILAVLTQTVYLPHPFLPKPFLQPEASDTVVIIHAPQAAEALAVEP